MPYPTDNHTVAVRHRAFTLVELMVVVGIVGRLVGLLLPGLAQARRAARRTACLAKLQQIATAAQVHATAHHGYYPVCG